MVQLVMQSRTLEDTSDAQDLRPRRPDEMRSMCSGAHHVVVPACSAPELLDADPVQPWGTKFQVLTLPSVAMCSASPTYRDKIPRHVPRH